jgi:hypothetical protein
MNTVTALADETTVRLRLRLLELARRQDDLAAEQAAATPYWKPQPATVHGHRSAADALRAEADLLIGRAS